MQKKTCQVSRNLAGESDNIKLMLEQILGKLRHRISPGSFGEVNRAIRTNVEIVERHKPDAIGFHGQHFYFTRLVHR